MSHSQDSGIFSQITGYRVDKGSEWILSVARQRDPVADPVGMLRHAKTC